MTATMPDAMPGALPNAMRDALLDALPNAQHAAMRDAMHATQRNATNEESLPRGLITDHRTARETDKGKCAECGRMAKVRGVCGTCYERHRDRGTLDQLAPRKTYRHTFDGCEVCDEVTALTAYGWDARTILAALHRNAEHVLRHLRQYQHPHAEAFLPLATEATRERKKATA